jgi:hypothetical protein
MPAGRLGRAGNIEATNSPHNDPARYMYIANPLKNNGYQLFLKILHFFG